MVILETVQRELQRPPLKSCFHIPDVVVVSDTSIRLHPKCYVGNHGGPCTHLIYIYIHIISYSLHSYIHRYIHIHNIHTHVCTRTNKYMSLFVCFASWGLVSPQAIVIAGPARRQKVRSRIPGSPR